MIEATGQNSVYHSHHRAVIVHLSHAACMGLNDCAASRHRYSALTFHGDSRAYALTIIGKADLTSGTTSRRKSSGAQQMNQETALFQLFETTRHYRRWKAFFDTELPKKFAVSFMGAASFDSSTFELDAGVVCCKGPGASRSRGW